MTDWCIFNTGFFVGVFDRINGDGMSTFAVPDLRGEFLRGSGTAARNSGSGDSVGKHQNATTHQAFMIFGGAINAFVDNNSTSILNSNTEPNRNPDFAYGSRKYAVNVAGKFNSFSSNEPTVFASRPTNTSVLYCIKYEPTYFLHIPEVKYSYEERRIGTWVDGKPLYEKTVYFGNLPNTATKYVVHGIDNADVVWIHDGFVYNTSNHSAVTLSYFNSNGDKSWYFTSDRSNILCGTSENRTNLLATVTLRYTKTTDIV